tara:strand:+ start:405 stop:575 length:171 start_codon:yes stop_codon:yes gene_type:complete
MDTMDNENSGGGGNIRNRTLPEEQVVEDVEQGDVIRAHGNGLGYLKTAPTNVMVLT